MDHNTTNQLIDVIIATPTDDIMDLAQKWKKTLRGVFLKKGMPTDEYKQFLLYIVERIPSLTLEQNDKIYRFLFLWEQEALTGMMYVHPGEPMYDMYYNILQAIFGDQHIPGIDASGTIEISNTNVYIIIDGIKKGCTYHPCKRKNPLHIKLMHSKKDGGKRSTKKHSTKKRSTNRIKRRRKHSGKCRTHKN